MCAYRYIYTHKHTHIYSPDNSIHQKILTLSFLTVSNFNALLTLEDKNMDKFYGHLDTKISGSTVNNL